MDDEATGAVSRRATLRLSVPDVGKEMAESRISDRVDGSARGGLQTPKEKCASRANAIKHGLTAGELLPAVMGHEVIEHAYERLLEEWQPSTATQRYLVREMARHEAALERAEEIEAAVLRRGARGAPRIAFGEACEDDLSDALLAGAGTSDALDRIARYRKSHERAYLRSLRALMDAKAMAAKQPVSHQGRRRFSSESECEAYLVARLADGGFRCPNCSGNTGKWIASRKTWQCRGCRRQVGIRVTTVMERSRVGLLAWFRAVETLLESPSASTAEISAAIGVRREGTVRRIARKIRQATSSAQRSVLLAGLDQVFGAEVCAEQDVCENKIMQNENV